jgi:hypothetical protein
VTEQGRLTALRLSGFQCPLCDYELSWAPCQCLLACGSPACRSGPGAACPPSVREGGLIIPDIASAVTAAEAEALADLARGKVVLELGAWHGFSTVVLASVADFVVSVDWHMGDAHAGQQDTWAVFCDNLKRHGVSDRIQVIRERFDTALPRLAIQAGGPFADGCFLDAQHDEASVTKDLALALPLIKPGGFMAFHDYGRGPHNGHQGFAVTPVADRFGVAGVVGYLAWGFVPGGLSWKAGTARPGGR